MTYLTFRFARRFRLRDDVETDCPKLCFQRATTSGAGAAARAVLVDGQTSVLPQVDHHCRRRAGSVSVMRGTGVCDEEGWKAGSGSGASAAYRSPLWLR